MSHSLARQRPRMVSVVLPVRNGAATLPAQLAALADQTYRGEWEVVVADNSSTDDTVRIAEGWSDRLPLQIVAASGPVSVSHGRNVGAEMAQGDFIAFCDADDIVSRGWLEALVGAAADFDIVAGSLNDSLNSPRVRKWRPLAGAESLNCPLDFLPSAPGGNCGVWADVIAAIGGWNEGFAGGSDDVDFAWRAQLAGYTIGFEPSAVLYYRYRDDIISLARQFYRYGRSEARLLAEFEQFGIKRPGLRDATSAWVHLILAAPVRLLSSRRGEWIRECAYRVGRIRGAIPRRRRVV